MAISQKDIKLLWGRSASRCAVCKVELSQDKQHAPGALLIGEQAHIVGEKEDAPRGKSVLTDDERNSYHNLILLCPNHHTEVDKNDADYPVEKLHMLKAQHELWVQQTLAETSDTKKVAVATVVAAIIDNAVELCHLRDWAAWTSWALAPDPVWEKDIPRDILRFRKFVLGAVWPEGYDELRRSVLTLAILLHKASSVFTSNCEERRGQLMPDKFNMRLSFNPNYDEDVEKYEGWLDDCYRTMRESAKAVNWFADVVRRDVNPMFFAVEGRFLVEEGPFDDLQHRTSLLEFTDEEKAGLPASLK